MTWWRPSNNARTQVGRAHAVRLEHAGGRQDPAAHLQDRETSELFGPRVRLPELRPGRPVHHGLAPRVEFHQGDAGAQQHSVTHGGADGAAVAVHADVHAADRIPVGVVARAHADRLARGGQEVHRLLLRLVFRGPVDVLLDGPLGGQADRLRDPAQHGHALALGREARALGCVASAFAGGCRQGVGYYLLVTFQALAERAGFVLGRLRRETQALQILEQCCTHGASSDAS
jgi:hypothetical protein